MTDWKQIQDTPSAEMEKRWHEEEQEQNAFEELSEVAYPFSAEHLAPERFELDEQRMRKEIDPYYLEPPHE